MARRKRLIGKNYLNKAKDMLDMGVPMSKIHKQLGLDKVWSYQSTSDILHAEKDGLESVTRPAWLLSEPLVQETPVDWQFEGTFPYGEWSYRGKTEFIPPEDATLNEPDNLVHGQPTAGRQERAHGQPPMPIAKL